MGGKSAPRVPYYEVASGDGRPLSDLLSRPTDAALTAASIVRTSFWQSAGILGLLLLLAYLVVEHL